MQKIKQGFTLIELLVVVLIIAILTTIAIPQYQKTVKKAQGTEALTVLEALDKALSNYYLENDTYENTGNDPFPITLPKLKHFQFAIGSVEINQSPIFTTHGKSFSFKEGAVNTLSHINGTDASVTLIGPKEEIVIQSFWKQGKNTEIQCKGKTISCDAYFACSAPFVQVSSYDKDGNVVSTYRTGGNCKLK